MGAGTGAGHVGLGLALSKHGKQPDIYFDAREPAKAMWSAGFSFWQALRNSVPDYYFNHYHQYQYSTPKNPPELPAFTCHKDKEDSLNQAVDSSYVWNEEKGAKPYVSNSIKPYPPWDLPKASILLLREATARHKADKQG